MRGARHAARRHAVVLRARRVTRRGADPGVGASDAARQAEEARVPDPGVAFHPWYPVLEIGHDKAVLYSRALIGDIIHKRRNLTDPGWLLRVGLYLEFLTFLGITEAVKDNA